MTKALAKSTPEESASMRAEYDFAGGARGKHYRAMQAGCTITIHHADGATEVREIKPREDAIVLAPDVRDYFPDSESVNRALRSLIDLIPGKRRPAGKRSPGTGAKNVAASGKHSKSTGIEA